MQLKCNQSAIKTQCKILLLHQSCSSIIALQLDCMIIFELHFYYTTIATVLLQYECNPTAFEAHCIFLQSYDN